MLSCCLGSWHVQVQVKPTGRALVLLLEPRYDAVCVEVVLTLQEEDFITLLEALGTNGTYLPVLGSVDLLRVQPRQELLFHCILRDLICKLFIPDLLERHIINTIYR